MSDLIIRRAEPRDAEAWVRLRHGLWPTSSSAHADDVRRFFDEPRDGVVTFIAEVRGRAVGFIEADERSYAPECASSPVPFIEGWYVEPAARRTGVGRALVEAVEAWARERGHSEIASDVELGNLDGQRAHEALGYEETDRVVSYRKQL